MGGNDRGAPETEAQEIVASILDVPEQKIPVCKHGCGRRCSRRVKSAPGCTARLNPSGCSIEVYQGVGVKPHILVDVMQDNLGIQGRMAHRAAREHSMEE